MTESDTLPAPSPQLLQGPLSLGPLSLLEAGMLSMSRYGLSGQVWGSPTLRAPDTMEQPVWMLCLNLNTGVLWASSKPQAAA